MLGVRGKAKHRDTVKTEMVRQKVKGVSLCADDVTMEGRGIQCIYELQVPRGVPTKGNKCIISIKLSCQPVTKN